MSNFLAYGNRIVGGGGSSQSGGGHVIVNASGTELAQEDKLQFVGSLKTTDDSTNGKTIVDDSPTEMTWTAWSLLTPAQQAAIPKALITDVPGASGSISANLLTKLWENNNPSATFAAQDITLSSSDYDFLFIQYSSTSAADNYSSTIIEKGLPAALLDTATTGSAGARTRVRSLTRVSDTVYHAENAGTAGGSTAGSVDNDCIIPLSIYGIKKTISLSFNAIASDVSTSANKCMLSDGVTSVEAKFNEIKSLTSEYTTTGLVSCLQYGKIIQATIEVAPLSSITHGAVIIDKLPVTAAPCYMTVGMANGQSIPCLLSNVSGQNYANLIVYYPGSSLSAARIDATLTYITYK